MGACYIRQSWYFRSSSRRRNLLFMESNISFSFPLKKNTLMLIFLLKKKKQTGQQFNFKPLSISTRAAEFYNYNSAARPSSSNFGASTPSMASVQLSRRLTIFSVIDYQNIISLVFHAGGPQDGHAGEVEVKIHIIIKFFFAISHFFLNLLRSKSPILDGILLSVPL